MKKIHFNFKKISTFFTMLLVLILCTIPISVIASDVYTGTEEVSLGITGSNSGSGSAYAGQSSLHGTNAIDTGYRVYLVEKNPDGTVSIMEDADGNQYVHDLTFFNPNTMGIDVAPKTSRLGTVSGDIPYRQISTSTLMTPIGTNSSDDFIAQGDALAKKMLEENSDGVVYAQTIIKDTFGEEAIDACRGKTVYLIVEPIWCAYVWTSYSTANISTERVYDKEEIGVYEHMYIKSGDVEIDLCCDGQGAASAHGLKYVWDSYFYPTNKTDYELGKGKYLRSKFVTADTYTETKVYTPQYSGIYSWGRYSNTVSESTGTMFYGTYYEWLEKLNEVGSNGGFLAGPKEILGSSLFISENALGLTAGTTLSDGCKETWSTIGHKDNPNDVDKGYGIHIYDMKDVLKKQPIHTKDPLTPDPSKPHPAEEPKPENSNDGKCTIIKVYGDVYADGGKYYHIEDVVTKVRKGTTDSIIIEQESPYNLVEWRISEKTITSITASQWKGISSTNTLKDNILPFSTIEIKKSGEVGLLHGEDSPYNIGDGNTIYLLYLRTLPPLETSYTPVTGSTFPTPKPTYPENPYTPSLPNPLKQGTYNIVKVYTLLDEYSGLPIKTEVYSQTKTTAFIKIERESGWTLATWLHTNTHTTSLDITKIHKQATTDSDLKSLYENGYLLHDQSNFNLGTIHSSGRLENNLTYKNVYFNTTTTSDTLYIFFTRLDGDAKYSSDTRLISESYILRRLSTSGQYRKLGDSLFFDRNCAMNITYTGVSLIV